MKLDLTEHVFSFLSLLKTAFLLGAVPSALEECVHSVPDPQHLKTVLLYHTTLGHFDLSGEFCLGSEFPFFKRDLADPKFY